MIEPGAELVFVWWAYAGVGIAVAALIITTIVSARRTKARLEALERQGIGRRGTR